MGGSGGGFASLYYSWMIPGSVAIALNPQTSLNRYRPGPIKIYRAACWPNLAPDQPLNRVIDVELDALYAGGAQNSIVYLQVASDYYHLTRHFAPFVGSLPRDYSDRLVVRMENWGRKGHQAAPSKVWIPWLNAALNAPTTTASAIEETWTVQNPISLPRLEPLRGPLRDEEIAAGLARDAAGPLLAPRTHERLLL
jgi:hypothetical protein